MRRIDTGCCARGGQADGQRLKKGHRCRLKLIDYLSYVSPTGVGIIYYCSLYSVEDVPFEKRSHPILGTINIVFFLVSEVLCIPCIFAISRYLKESCYKILFCISLMDFFALFIAGLLTGIFGIQGTVYCSSPRFMYSIGVIGNFFYAFETMASIILAANRCLEAINSKTAKRFFCGQKTWFWIGFVWLYSIYNATFNKPTSFNSITYTWVFNPHSGYIDGLDNLYNSNVDIVHEAFVAILIPSFYCLFLILLNKKQKLVANKSTMNLGKANQKIIFMQIFLLSLLNATISICYLMMAFTEVSPTVTIICGTYGWLLLHGFPPFIYLSLNRTLRNECVKIVKKWIKIGNQNNKQENMENAIAMQIHFLGNPAVGVNKKIIMPPVISNHF